MGVTVEYLLDTNVLIEWFSQGPSQSFLVQALKSAASRLSTSWICAAEFLAGAGRKEAQALYRIFERGEMYLHDVGGLDELDRVSRLRRRLKLPLPDCIILATAEQWGATLVTRDRDLAVRGRRWYAGIQFVDG